VGFRSILHVNEKGGRFGGTEEYLALLTEELASSGVRSHLICGVSSADHLAGLTSVEVIEGLADRDAPADVGNRLVDAVARLRPDVVYLHNIFDADVVHQLAAMPHRPVLVWYVHDHYVTCLSELRWRRDVGACPVSLGSDCLAALAERQCVLRFVDGFPDAADLARRMALSAALMAVDAVVVVSGYMRSLLLEAQPGLEGKLHVVPRPVRLRQHQFPRPNRAEPGAVVTFAGRITPEKGLAVLIEALGRARFRVPVELRIAGVSEHENYHANCVELAERAARANPLLRVRWLGHLDYAGVDELLAESDVAAVPSQWPEPLGAIALEAMAAGAVVVASDIGGLGTYLISGRNCVLTRPDDVDGWARAIEGVVDQRDWAARLSARARTDVAGLTVGAHVDELAAIIGRADALLDGQR
jgi:glycosyltransferase involved in cell wall biosynthesis